MVFGKSFAACFQRLVDLKVHGDLHGYHGAVLVAILSNFTIMTKIEIEASDDDPELGKQRDSSAV